MTAIEYQKPPSRPRTTPPPRGRSRVPPRCCGWPRGSPREGGESRRAALRQRRTRGIHHHGEQRVVALDADRVDDALLAELGDRALVGDVADALGAVQLRAEVVDDLFVLGHLLRTASLGDGFGDLRVQAGLERERVMRVPLVV